MLAGTQLEIERHQHSARVHDGVRRDKPLRLVCHYDRRPAAGLQTRILQRARKGKRSLLERGVCKAAVLAIAVRLYQADLVGPALESISKSRAKAGVLAQIKHANVLTKISRINRKGG